MSFSTTMQLLFLIFFSLIGNKRIYSNERDDETNVKQRSTRAKKKKKKLFRSQLPTMKNKIQHIYIVNSIPVQKLTKNERFPKDEIQDIYANYSFHMIYLLAKRAFLMLKSLFKFLCVVWLSLEKNLWRIKKNISPVQEKTQLLGFWALLKG